MKLTLPVLVTACKSSVALTNNLPAYDNYCIKKKKERDNNNQQPDLGIIS